MKQKVEIEVEVPDGYEATGKYREPCCGEFCLDCYGEAEYIAHDGEKRQCIILRKKALTGQAWVNSLPMGTMFSHKGFAHQKCDHGVFVVGCEYPKCKGIWSDETCKILYRPGE